MFIADTHVHVFTDDRKNYPQIRDTPRAGSIPSITEIGQTEWPVTTADRRGKFLDCASTLLPSKDARALLDAAEGCMRLDDISSLVSLTIPAKQRPASLRSVATDTRAQVSPTEST